MVDTCIFGLTKNEDQKKIGKFTAYFASSQQNTQHRTIVGDFFSSCHLLIFLALSETMYLLANRSYRGILCVYLWYSKKKGVNVGNPRHENTVRVNLCQ